MCGLALARLPVPTAAAPESAGAADLALAAPEGRRFALASVPRPTGLGWGVIAGALVLLTSAVVGAYLLLFTPAPDVVGLPPVQASRSLQDAGFALGQQARDFSPTVSRGLVMTQDPPGGTRQRSGSTVSVVVSRGPAVLVPDVVGLTVEASGAALTDLKLAGEVTRTSSTTAPEGTVLAQDTAAGALVEEGSTVRVVVSSGPPTTTMTVTLNLHDGYDSCSYSLGYYDIPGASIDVYAEGVLVASDSLPYRGVDRGNFCEYTASIPDVPTTASSYSLEIGSGRRGVLEMTGSELKNEDWVWMASLGL